MPFILDTHTFLWFVAGDKMLPVTLKEKIKDINQVCFISVASFWEIAIKIQLGKLKLDLNLEDLYRFAERNQIEVIQINEKHLLKLLELDFFHNDPFDRLIISQAITEKLILLSKYKEFKKYKIKVQWA
jgi:PIN domain nuclease of toxin-antitoxin system